MLHSVAAISKPARRCRATWIVSGPSAQNPSPCDRSRFDQFFERAGMTRPDGGPPHFQASVISRSTTSNAVSACQKISGFFS